MNVSVAENLVRNYSKSLLIKSDDDVKVLKGINFTVEEGEFLEIMGKSGCGKTTFLKVLGMIDRQTSGRILFMGQDTETLYGDKLADISSNGELLQPDNPFKRWRNYEYISSWGESG